MDTPKRMHYVPQAYLKEFGLPGRPGQVWVYDKQENRRYPAVVSDAAVMGNAYPQEVEAELARMEDAALVPLKNLREGRELNLSDREWVVRYVVTMVVRGPAERERNSIILSKRGESLSDRLHAVGGEGTERSLAQWELIRDTGLGTERRDLLSELQAKAQEGKDLAVVLDNALSASRDETHRNSGFSKLTRTVHPSEGMAEALRLMEWNVLRTDSDNCYITSDNPVCIKRGPRTIDREVVFPLSSYAALCCRPGEQGLLMFSEVNIEVVTEINRTIANNAHRFIYSNTNAQWIEEFANASHE